jgi:hypothetical protein
MTALFALVVNAISDYARQMHDPICDPSSLSDFPKRHERACHAATLHVPSTRKSLPHLLYLIAERPPGPLFSSFAVAANDLDPVRLNRDIVFHLESHILDQEGPHLVAEAVSIKMALDRDHRVSLIPRHVATPGMLVKDLP